MNYFCLNDKLCIISILYCSAVAAKAPRKVLGGGGGGGNAGPSFSSPKAGMQSFENFCCSLPQRTCAFLEFESENDVTKCVNGDVI